MAGDRKRRIPKRIGGVKIPKDVRRHGEALIDAVLDHARGPAGRQAMFELMGIVSRALMEAMAREAFGAAPVESRRRPPRRPPPPIPPEPVTPPRPPVPPMPPAGAASDLREDRADAPDLPPEIARVIGSVAAGLERWAARMGPPRG